MNNDNGDKKNHQTIWKMNLSVLDEIPRKFMSFQGIFGCHSEFWLSDFFDVLQPIDSILRYLMPNSLNNVGKTTNDATYTINCVRLSILNWL